MKTLKTTTIQKRLNASTDKFVLAMIAHKKTTKELRARCPHEKTQRENHTVYCSTCDKVLNVR